MIRFHYDDLATSRVLAARFEDSLKSSVDGYYRVNSAPSYCSTAPGTPPRYWNGTIGSVSGVTQDGIPFNYDSENAYGYLSTNTTCDVSGIAIPFVSEAESYYSIVALSARQIMGAYVLTRPPSATCSISGSSTPLLFQKEISSDGNVNTVDVVFPALPFFLWANPVLIKYNLEPLFQNQEGGFYPNQYSMHDLGTHYPNATGHVEGNDEYMPVEESGNMIIMSYAYFKFSGDLAFLQAHYAILKQWATYLIDYSLIPGQQLSTDDFAGRLANQTNLAIKGIVGLKAMSFISAAVGDAANAANYSSTATRFYAQWEEMAIDPSGRHTLLAYQWRSSWGLLYNIFPDKLLGLGIIPQNLYDMQSAWYPTVSQIFGVPLDNRHDYTKSDWEVSGLFLGVLDRIADIIALDVDSGVLLSQYESITRKRFGVLAE